VIVLDTHAWVWWVGAPAMLSPAARERIDEATQARRIFISSFSAWEVALLAARGRLRLAMDTEEWVARSQALPFLRFVPVDHAIAMRSVRLLPPLHADPADRIIVATALTLGAELVTKDERLLAYPGVRTVW
jgi:PIN domain nuclease of toxin-antitoxin system